MQFERIRNFLYPLRYILTTSPRKALFLNSLIIALTSMATAAFSFFICVIFYQSAADQGDKTFYNWLILGLVSCALTSICIIGMRGAHLVSLELLMIHFWGITIFIAPLILGTVAGFDFYFYLSIWFRHQWETPVFLEVVHIQQQQS